MRQADSVRTGTVPDDGLDRPPLVPADCAGRMEKTAGFSYTHS